MLKSTFSGLFIIIISLGVIHEATARSTRWRYQPVAGYVDSSPAVADLDGDGSLDLVVATTAGRVLALDANGQQKWHYDTRQTISTPPTLMNVKPHHQILVLTNPGKILCLDGKSGAQIWEFSLPHKVEWGMTALAAADINTDGITEIVAADGAGHLICLNENGTPLWSITLQAGVNTAPALADLDNDGQSEILVGTKASPLICLSSTGQERWRLDRKDVVGSSPVVVDLNGDQQPEILVGRGNGLSLVSRQGKLLWHYPMKKPVHDAIALGDIDDDRQVEIVVVDLFGEVACLKPDGSPKWTANVEQRVRRSPAIADIDGDSTPEIIIGGYSSALHIFDPDGNLKEQVPLKAPMNATPTIVDFKGNDRLAVICATGVDVCAFSWMSSNPPVTPPVLWSEYRVNSARNGSHFTAQPTKRVGITKIDYGNLYVGSNEFKVTVENPQRQRLHLQLEVGQENGPPVQSKIISTDSSFSHSLAYTVTGQRAMNLKFGCKLFSGKKTFAVREKTVYLVPFAKDVADLGQTLAAIEGNLSALADQEYVTERLQLFTARLATLEAKTKLAGPLSPLARSALRDNIARLRKDASRLQAMTDASVKAGTSLAVYAANPWAPFGGTDEIMEGRQSPAKLTLECFTSETESAALNIANFSSQAKRVRIELEPIHSLADSNVVIPARNVFSLHEVVAVPTEALDYSADALPSIGQAQTLLIPAWDLSQLWLNIKSDDLPAGDWWATLRVRSLEVEPKEAAASITIKVWPHQLPPQSPLRLCHWGYVHTSVLKDQPEAALEDQVAHGTNVFVATYQFAPTASFDDNGDIIGAVDFSEHDPYVHRHAPHGIILFFNYQASLKGPAEKFTPTWKKAYQQWLQTWTEHLAQLGLTYQDYAFYPVDEPGLNEGLVDAFIDYAKPIRELNPRVQIYTDPVARATMADLKRMAPYVDIWCPNRNGYLLNRGADKLAFIKSTGKTVWTYECDGNAKHQSPLGYYRSQAWLVWQHGLTGIGFWSYCTSQHNPWYLPVGGHDYLLIYPGDGVVTSKRWEAIRDGVEDYCLLVQLQEAVQKAATQPELARTVQLAQKVLSDEATAIAQFCGLDADGTLPGVRGMGFRRPVADKRWEKIQAVRRKIAGLLEKMQ